jgi:hypothetical protein
MKWESDRIRTICRFALNRAPKNIFGRSSFFSPKVRKKMNVYKIFSVYDFECPIINATQYDPKYRLANHSKLKSDMTIKNNHFKFMAVWVLLVV